MGFVCSKALKNNDLTPMAAAACLATKVHFRKGNALGVVRFACAANVVRASADYQ